MSVTILESGVIRPGQTFTRSWPLAGLLARYHLAGLGVAGGAPYDDDGAGAVTVAGVQAAGARRSGWAVGAVNLETQAGRIRGNLARFSAADLGVASGYSSRVAAQIAAENTTRADALLVPERAGRAWDGGIEPLARSGLWVRRRSWTDGTRRLRYEAGAGTVPAVAVLRSASVETRTVLNVEFGEAEFRAVDWVLADPLPAALEDLTAAVLTLTLSVRSDGGADGRGEWLLYGFGDPVLPPPGGGEPPPGGDEPPPVDGTYVWGAIAGVKQWLPTRECDA